MLVALPSAAVAQCVSGAAATLTDSAGYVWDIDEDGAVIGGSNGAFDGLYTLTIEGSPYRASVAPTTELGGRQLLLGAFTIPGLSVFVRRRVYVPTGEAWARWIDEYSNIGTTARTVNVVLGINAGADAELEVVTTSDGDAVLETTDRSFVFDNELTPPPPPPMETPPPATCQVLWGSGATVTPSALTSGAPFTCSGNEGATVRYTLTLPPAGVMRVMYFAAQSDTRAGAMAACTSFTTLPGSAFADLPPIERAQLVNWPAVEQPNGAPCTVDGGCTSAHCVDGVCCESTCGGGVPNDCQACSDAAGSSARDGTCGVARSTYACRPAASLCDVPERCDGSARTCPADVVRTSGYVCRSVAGACDVAETCNGTSGACPADVVRPAGTVCDPLGTIPCWEGGECNGTTGACPLARTVVDRTACDDGIACTESWCVTGACISPGPACDDGDLCTTDSCAGSACSHVEVGGCDGGIPPLADAGPLELADAGATDDAAIPDFDGGPDFDAGDEDASSDLDGGRLMDTPRRRDGAAPDDLEVGGGGCVCRARTGGSSGGPLVLGVLLAVALARWRRAS